MKEVTPLLLFFIFVTLSHALFLLMAKKSLWKIHFTLNSVLWAILLLWVFVLQFQKTDLSFVPILRWAGVLMIITGWLLVLRVSSVLNLKELMGLRFFYPSESRKIKDGIYKYLNNPMYDGFILLLVGFGFSLGLAVDFYLAGASFILLNIFLASVENFKLSWNPF